MVQLTRIYTRGGDKGKTSLGDGSRVFKSSARIQAIGAVDESNSALGVAHLFTTEAIQSCLLHIQNDLFDLGADLCMPTAEAALRVTPQQILWLEQQIDAFNASLSPLTSFVLPGGSKGSAFLHIARASVRAAERDVISLEETEGNVQPIAQYLNRLSDLLFVLARMENDEGRTDVLWQPGKNQQDKK